MARTRRIASMDYRGALPFRRHVECATVVPLPYRDVERAARVCLGELVADPLFDAQTPQPKAVARMARMGRGLRGLRGLRVAVEPEVSSPRTRHGALGHVHWHARRLRRLFPGMEADLIVRPLSGGRTRLVLEAASCPAGGVLGAVGDRLVGRVVARSTAEAVIGRLAQAMEQALTDRRCGSWSSPHASSEAA